MGEEDFSAVDWSALSPQDTLARLGTSVAGLSEAEACSRQARFGPNRLPQAKRRSALMRFLAQFHNVLIYILLASAAVSALMAHWVDCSVILGVILINALIGFIQEDKAERAVDAVRDMLAPQAVVKRDGQIRNLTAESLVPGDIIFLAAGDKAPADVRLVETRELAIQEAALTGESLPVEKNAPALTPGAALAERSGMAFCGTLAVRGRGMGVVVAIASATEIGRVSELLSQVAPLTTPLLEKMEIFGRWLSALIVAVAGAAFLIGTLAHGFPAQDTFMAAVGLAVAAIPEGLPAIITITLALGVHSMAARRAIVRHLPAVETLGAVTVICSDKTGTLTSNALTVETVIAGRARYAVTGTGYRPEGRFLKKSAAIDPVMQNDLLRLLDAAHLCNDAALEEKNGQWETAGDPVDGALLALAGKAGMALTGDQARRIDALPFESEHRYMATLHRNADGRQIISVKGAPERIFALCEKEATPQTGEQPFDLAYWRRQAEILATEGYRVLAVAGCYPANSPSHLSRDSLGQNLTLLGLVGLIDPPRPEAVAAVKSCRQAGVFVKMITGDHPLTASAVAETLGLANPGLALTGSDLDALSDQELISVVRDVSVFARATPEHKLRLVAALQADNQVVAMTGDGVNDAPALKRADVGIAMGRAGTEAAKEAAEVVLADDNFATIAAAIAEGRRVFDNLKKAILFILPTNGGQALTVLAAVLLGVVTPITPVQILWVNLITAVTLSLALVFEPAESDVMHRIPRRRDAPLLSPPLVWRVTLVSFLIMGAAFVVYLWESAIGADTATARTATVNAIVVCESFYLWNARFLSVSSLRPESRHGATPALITITLVLVFQLAFTYWPLAQELFGSAPLDMGTWTRLILVGAAVFCVIEMDKWALRALGRKNSLS